MHPSDPRASDTRADRPTPLNALLADRYRVERELGVGGMATVYLAEDTRHHRNVAIKVLHAELSAVLGPERFLKEIELTASFQHPHILPLFDSGAANGLLYYVMPFVDGETLRARLERDRQLPIADALRIATECADALQYAHGRGVVHRDIKPENILLQNGHALLADFGIALAIQQASGSRMTQTGLSLGTPQYMSPEQAMGEREIGPRSDIYSLAAVTYEMLTGSPPFTGPTAQAIVAQVITGEPPVPSDHRRNISQSVDAALCTALEKLPADRFGSAAEFSAALNGDGGPGRPGPGVKRAGRAGVRGTGTRSRWPGIAAGLVGVAGLTAAIAMFVAWRAAARGADQLMRFSIPAPAPDDAEGENLLAVAPDGRTIGYLDPGTTDSAGIYIRRLDRATPDHIAGTAGAETIAFSPDGGSIAYSTRDNELRIVSIHGGASVPIARNAAKAIGIDWSDDGFVYFVDGDSSVVARVRATGGPTELIGTLERSAVPIGYRIQREPRVLPGGNAVLYSVYRGPGRESDIYAIDLRTRKTSFLIHGSNVLGVQDGQLLFVSADGTLEGIPFDTKRLATHGLASPLLTGIHMTEATPQIALGGGTLVHLPALARAAQLVWVSGDGMETPLGAPLERPVAAVSISPRGGQIAVGEGEDQGTVWLYDIANQTLSPFLSNATLNIRPRWSPDGSSIVFGSDRGSADAVRSLWIRPADGRDTARLFITSPRHVQELSWVAASPFVVFREGYDDGKTLRDLRYTRPGSDTVRTFLATSADEFNPALAPDGRWLAYVSNQTGRDEVYIAPFPGPGAATQVSRDGGTGPLWSHDGRALFYRAVDGRFIEADVTAADQLTLGSRRALFSALPYVANRLFTPYDISPDDKRFLFIKPPAARQMDVAVHWTERIASGAGREP